MKIINLFRQFASRKFLLRIMIWMILIAMVPVMIFSVQSIANMKRMNRQKAEDETDAAAARMGIILSLLLDNLSMQNLVLADTKEATDFVTYKNGSNLESEKAPFTNQADTYFYVFAKRDFRNTLLGNVTQNPVIHSIYYCDINKNLMMNTAWLDSTIERFYDIAWMEKINWNFAVSPVYLPLRSITIPDGQSTMVISAVYRPFLTYPDVALVYNLDPVQMMNKLTGGEQLLPGDSLTVRNGDRNEIFSYHNGKITLLNGEEPAEGYTASWLGTNGWSLTMTRNLQAMLADESATERSVIVIAVSVSLFMFLLMFLLLLQVYQPLTRWSMQVKGEVKPGQESWITKGTEVEAFGEWLQVSGTALRTRFWTQAVMGRIENLEHFDHVHFHVALKDFLLSVVSLENSENRGDAGDEILACSAMAQLLRQNLADDPCDVVEMNDDIILILMNCTGDTVNTAKGHLLDVYKSTAQSFANASDIAVGGFCTSLKDVKECYSRALLLLHYQRMTGNLQTQYSLNVENSMGSLMPRIQEMEKSLSVSIAHHDYDEAENILKMIKKGLQEHMGAMDLFQIKHRILHLTTQLLEDYQQENGAVNAALHLPEDFYSRILTCDNLDTLWTTLSGLVRKMRENGGSETVAPAKGPVSMILEMLEKDCGRDMNLAQLSEKIGMSSVYISKAFKQTVGENYTQYLTSKRMEKAKELLLTTDLQIQEIADKVGYSQSHYFSKVFREYSGLSPRDFVLKRTNREPPEEE